MSDDPRRPSVPHLEAIGTVFEALRDVDTAAALVICEDVFVGLSLGLGLGMTMAQIADQHAAIVRRVKDGA